MQQLISHLQIICDNVYRENAFAVYDHKLNKKMGQLPRKKFNRPRKKWAD